MPQPDPRVYSPGATARDGELGTEELEKGMRPGRASHAALIGAIAMALLLVVNSGGLAKWTQDLPSTPANIWLAERAADWHRLMTGVGPAAWFEALRRRVRGE